METTIKRDWQPLAMQIGIIIRERRKLLGISARELSHRANVSGHLFAIETKPSNVSALTLHRIASGLGTTARRILERAENTNHKLVLEAWYAGDDEFIRLFSQNIAVIRKGIGLLQVEISQATGLGREYLSELEHGKCNPTLSTLVLLADALEVSMADLFP